MASQPLGRRPCWAPSVHLPLQVFLDDRRVGSRRAHIFLRAAQTGASRKANAETALEACTNVLGERSVGMGREAATPLLRTDWRRCRPQLGRQLSLRRVAPHARVKRLQVRPIAVSTTEDVAFGRCDPVRLSCEDRAHINTSPSRRLLNPFTTHIYQPNNYQHTPPVLMQSLPPRLQNYELPITTT